MLHFFLKKYEKTKQTPPIVMEIAFQAENSLLLNIRA